MTEIKTLTDLQRLMEDFCIWHKERYKGPPDFRRVPTFLNQQSIRLCKGLEK